MAGKPHCGNSTEGLFLLILKYIRTTSLVKARVKGVEILGV